MMADSTHSRPQPQTMRSVARALPADGLVNVGDGERWLSLLGGGLLALYTLRRSLGTVVLLGGAGALLYRGLKGQCGSIRRWVSAPWPMTRHLRVPAASPLLMSSRGLCWRVRKAMLWHTGTGAQRYDPP